MRLRKLNRVLHRDLGYFFLGMTLIYAVSGIALNHRHEWNPNYIITQEKFVTDPGDIPSTVEKDFALEIIDQLDTGAGYKTHIVSGNTLRIFVEGGSVNLNLSDGSGNMEIIRKRPVFNQVNYLHYNTPRKIWTWFSDFYAGGLIIISITGLFIIRGKNGITGRGAWLSGLGILIPLILLYMYI